MRRAMIGIMAGALVEIVGLGVRDAAAQCCGDCDGQSGVTVDEVVTVVSRALEQPCSDDEICSAESCPAKLATCQTELAQCQSQSGGRFPASGQTTAYGPGSDGDVRAGAALSYTDNGDGTITDNVTGLMWEKKDDSGGIHDKDNLYTWGTAFPPYTMNGTMVTEFLLRLNTDPCFAAHCDWRIPNVKELQSIVDYENVLPAVDAAFHNAAGCEGCTDVRLANCSCTGLPPFPPIIPTPFYWSSTTFRWTPGYAWGVSFEVGFIPDRQPKYVPSFVRAVRGGS